MLADDERVDRTRIDAEMRAEIVAQTGGIQNGARSENAVIRQTGQLLDVELTSPSGEVQSLNLYLRSGKGAAE